MIITDDVPPSPAKSSTAVSNPQSPVVSPPPAYGQIEERTVPRQPYQPYDAGIGPSAPHSNGPYSPLLSSNQTRDPERNDFRRRESAGKRFCKAFTVALFIYVLAGALLGTFTMNVKGGYRTEKGWHNDFPIPNDVAVISCTKGSEMKNSSWGLSEAFSEMDDHSSTSPKFSIGYGTISTSLFLPLSSETLFFLSRGVLSSGNLRIVSSPSLEDTRTARVDVETLGDIDLLGDTSVCLVQRRGGKEIGVGLFSPRSWSFSSIPSFYKVTLLLPEPHGPSALRLNTLETDLPNFHHIFTESLDEFVTFGNVALKGRNGVISVKSMTADKATMHTSNGRIDIESLTSRAASLYTTNAQIKGYFTVSESLEIKAENAKVNANIDLVTPEAYENDETRRILLETTNEAIEATINIHDPSYVSHSPSAYSISTTTDNGAIDLSVPLLPLDSALYLDASSRNARVTARLPETYEGAFTVSSVNAAAKVFIEPAEDPAGSGRKRALGSGLSLPQSRGGLRTQMIEDTIYWDKKNEGKGRIRAESSNENAYLYM